MEHTIGSRVADLMRLASILLLSALTAFAVVSCGGSDDTSDTPNPPVTPQPKADKPIAFSGDLSNGKSESHTGTRAGTALSATHQTFYAWAYKNTSSATETVMHDYTVKWLSGSAGSTTTNTQGWEYVNQHASGGTEQSVKYWDFSATDYRFFGYAGSRSRVTMKYYQDNTEISGNALMVTTPTKVTLSFTTDATSADLNLSGGNPDQVPLYSKLWYKSGTDLAAESTQPVQLEFLQPYVKVRFLFKQSAPEDVVFDVTDKSFKPTNNEKIIATAGTFTVTYPLTGATEESWSVTDGTTALTTAGVFTGFTVDNSWYVVLPAHGTGGEGQGSYTLLVSVNGEERKVVVPAQYMEWRPGYEYTYIFKITDAGGVTLDNVMVGFSGWTVEETNREIYNW